MTYLQVALPARRRFISLVITLLILAIFVPSLQAAEKAGLSSLFKAFATERCFDELRQTLTSGGATHAKAVAFCRCMGDEAISNTSESEMAAPDPVCVDAPSRFSNQQRHFCALVDSNSAKAFRQCEPVVAAQRDIFYLVVGSEHYISAPPETPNAIAFTSVHGIANGAERLADALQAGGAKEGTLLESRAGKYISREDVYGALEILIAHAKKSNQPFLVVYIGGHGIQNSFNKLQYFIPGNFVLNRDEIDIKTKELDPYFSVFQYSVPIRKLIEDFLEASKMPYLALIDLCREPSDKGLLSTEDFMTTLLGKQTAHNGLAGYEIFRDYWIARARFDGYLNPIILAAQPDQIAVTAQDPLDESGLLSVGPLARRILIAEQASSKGISLQSLVKRLVNDEALDSATQPAYTNTGIRASEVFVHLFGETARQTPILRTFGTAKRASVCCSVANEPRDRWAD